LERAVAYEIERQAKVLDKGGVILQETLGWDDAKQKTFTQRSKEGSADYRYFPDPDIPKLVISQIEGLKPEVILAGMPTLPWQKRDAYLSLGLRKDDAELYVRDNRFGSFFDAVASSLKNEVERVRIASNYIGTDLVKIIRDIEDRDSVIIDKIDIAAESFAELVDMIVTNTLSSRGAKDVLGILSESGGKPSQIAKEKGLLKESGTETLGPIVAKVIADNPAAADSFKAGKKESLQYLIGQGMKASRGSGDPAVFKDLFEKALA
jgi:aspartyl-tRNA(Asn)/glutamyl-tRNA(Gln) amidotransferase subunit B